MFLIYYLDWDFFLQTRMYLLLYHEFLAWNVFLIVFHAQDMLNLNMLKNQQNSMCYPLHESQIVLIYSKDINLLNGHNYL